MHIRSFCFSKFCLSFDFLSSLPELIIILTSSISALLISSIKVKIFSETLDIIIKYLPREPSINYLENLYHTSTLDIFDTVMLEAKQKKVLIVSHQPLLSNSIDNFFNGSQNKHYFNALTSYSTSSLFNVSFKCEEWHQISKSNSVLNFFIKPSEL